MHHAILLLQGTVDVTIAMHITLIGINNMALMIQLLSVIRDLR